MSATAIADVRGEVVEPTAVEVYHSPPASLFRTDDPVEIIEKASKVAEALKAVIVKQGLFARINGREHVLVEGWTTLGSMLGVVPVVIWSHPTEITSYDVEVIHYEWVTENDRRIKREKGRSKYTVEGRDWEARVEARTMDGRTVGAAEAMCSRSEYTWAKRDDYALRSMAQTRAVSKALRGPLGFIVALAGYASTPAEEMPPADVEPAGPPPRTPTRPTPTARPVASGERPASAEEKRKVNERAAAVELTAAEFANVILAAAGAERRRWDSTEACEQTLNRLLDRLPARLVDGVLDGIEAKANGGAA